jgi:hypothetical protein
MFGAEKDLSLIEERCRLKAEGAIWAATRKRKMKDGADFATDIEPHDTAIISRAKAISSCFLWMCHPSGPSPANLAQYEELAGCFEAAADAAALLSLVEQFAGGDRAVLEQAFHLAAEAQSALRVAVTTIGAANPDGDQARLFGWLRSAAQEHQIWISRYMRQDDPADPTQWAKLRERLKQCSEQVNRFKDRDKRRKKLLNNIKYRIKRIQAVPDADSADDWRSVIDAADQLVDEGVPPSNSELREMLLPILDEIPENLEIPKNFALVMREADRYLAASPPRPMRPVETAPSPELRRAAELVGGRSVVLIGGVKRPQQAEALTEALNLKELIWVEGRDQTYKDFEPHVANEDVACVVLAIRWSRHGFGEVKEFCHKYGKPLVRLPGGYNPRQVAYHIVNQVGDRLAAGAQMLTG